MPSRASHILCHLSFGVADLDRSIEFYDATLMPLNFVRVWTDETAAGCGREGDEDKFAIKLVAAGLSVPGRGFHLAFSADSRAAVDQFHAPPFAMVAGTIVHPVWDRTTDSITTQHLSSIQTVTKLKRSSTDLHSQVIQADIRTNLTSV